MGDGHAGLVFIGGNQSAYVPRFNFLRSKHEVPMLGRSIHFWRALSGVYYPVWEVVHACVQYTAMLTRGLDYQRGTQSHHS